ncbi:MAG TPA: DUF2568 domain-containing protein, partial [Acidimicrobiia bacterium]|nr:DUF2568 domain-containing protein [Acidimicrobiia bacterium]
FAVIAWGTFNVVDDPSRSGAAPVEVSGRTRLAIEALILGAGVAGVAIAWRTEIAIGLVVVIAFHYAMSWSRVAWLTRH